MYSSPYEAHLKIKGLLLPKIYEKNVMKSQKVICQKSQKLLTENLHDEAAYSEPSNSIDIHSISMAGYVSSVLAFFCAELSGRETSSFCDFLKVTSCDFIPIYSFLTQPNVCFLRCAW